MQTILSVYSLHVFWNLTIKEQIVASIFIVKKENVLKTSKIFLNTEF